MTISNVFEVIFKYYDGFCRILHCVKSVRIRSYFGPHFPTLGLNTERYGVSLRIQSECGKIRNRITPNTGIFLNSSRDFRVFVFR